jgi:heme exporter protein D
MCGYTCSVLLNSLIPIYVWLFVFIPITITVIGCILLPIRFVIQKRHLQQVQWHRARKMIVQTSMIAGAYTICWLPYTIILQLIVNKVLLSSDSSITLFLACIPYITSLLTPFIVFHTIRSQVNLPIVELIKRRFLPQRQGMIRPVIAIAVQRVNHLAFEEHNATVQ